MVLSLLATQHTAYIFHLNFPHIIVSLGIGSQPAHAQLVLTIFNRTLERISTPFNSCYDIAPTQYLFDNL